ncbi:MAG TPA: hypothetical protein VFB58_11980 [Chloroflexota bacterium]|nr:hypothetical protein [Chloroflexota bacterium]
MTPAEAADQRLRRRLLSVQGWETGSEDCRFVRGVRWADAIAGEDTVAAAEITRIAEKHAEIASGTTTVVGSIDRSPGGDVAALPPRSHCGQYAIAASPLRGRRGLTALRPEDRVRRRRVAGVADLKRQRRMAEPRPVI